MKRILAILLAVLAGTAVVAAPAMVSTDLAKRRIAEQLEAWTGGQASLRGEPEISIVPLLDVTVEDVVISGVMGAKGAPPITISSLRASLKLLPLLMGRVELDSLTLIKPQIRLVGNEIGLARQSGRAEGEDALNAAFSGGADERLGELFLLDGAIVYGDDHTGRTDVITEADLRLASDPVTDETAVSGRFAWRGLLVRIDAELDDLGAALSGAGSQGRLELATAPAESDGHDTRPPQSSLGLTSILGSVRRLADELGLPGGPIFSPLSVSGRFAVNDHAVTLSDGTFTFGKTSAKGRLSLGVADDQPILAKLLAIDEGDLAPYAMALERATLADCLTLPVSSDWLSRLDVDFKASADNVQLGSVEFDETTVSLVVREGGMTLKLRAAGSTAGRMEGNLSIGPAAGPKRRGIAVTLFGRLEDGSVADFGPLISAMGARSLISTEQPPQGTARAAANLSAEGATICELIDSLKGSATAEIRDGSINGADIVSTLERLKEGTSVMARGDAPFIPVAGRTHFEKLEARLDLDAGIARSDRINISGDRFEIAFRGEVNLKRGDLKAKGSASLLAPESRGGPLRRLVELPFGMGGTVREPVVAPGVPRIEERADSTMAPSPHSDFRFAHRLQDHKP